MVTVATLRGGKTQFVKQVLEKNGRANAAAVNQAWQAEGREGSISAALVNKLRATLELTGNLRARRKKSSDQPGFEKLPYTGKKRGRKPKNAPYPSVDAGQAHANGPTMLSSASAAPRGRPSFRQVAFEEIEADIDRLIFKVMALGGMPSVENALRQARRMLYGGFLANRN
jgi:hypothetical protein